MEFSAFHDLHRPALERDEARHNLLLALLAAIAAGTPTGRWWSLGGPGACALQVPGRPVVLGDLDEAQARDLAETLGDEDFPAVLGPDRTAPRFVSRVPVVISAGGADVEAVITDISSSGAFIETQLPLEPGTVVKIHYLMPGRKARNLLAAEMVRRTDHGFAVRFLPDEQQ